MREQVTEKLYKNVTDYLDMFQTNILERDPALDPNINDKVLITSTLAETPSLECFTGKAPLVSFNR